MASGAELIRKIKEQIHEVDPKDVHELQQNGNGAVIVDVREQHEFEQSHVPGAVHVPRGHLESRIEGAVGDRSKRVILYCASGSRSALAAHTLQEHLGYEDVASMRGGITLWKDRGYDVDVPVSLSPEQRERYSRHLLVPEVGLEGQLKLLDAKVLLLGAGGLGSPAALYLAAAGVGTIGIVDNDVVDLSNLQRQVAHSNDRIGMPKVDSAEISIHEINPDVKVEKHEVRLGPDNIMEIIEGYLSVFHPYEGPCYRCLYPTPPPAELAPSCGAAGVLGVLPGVMGLLQSVEVIKLITGSGETMAGRLLLYDALGTTFTELKVRRDPDCPICSRDPDSISDEELGVFPDYEAFCAGAG